MILERFETTYKTHYSKLYHLAKRVINDEDVARDIIQDVFVCYLEKTGQRYPFRDVSGWLARVTLNKSFDYLKQQKMQVQLDGLDGSCLQMEAAGTDVDGAAETDGVDNEHASRLRIRKAVAELKPQEAKLILLYSEGYSYKEIAEMAGIKFTSVGKTLSRIIGKLKEKLKQMGYEMY